MIDSDKRRKLRERFRNKLLKHIELFNRAVSTQSGDWVVKGFIDIAKNIYTISVDTKVVPKTIELLLFECNYRSLSSFFRRASVSILTSQLYEPHSSHEQIFLL